MKKTIGLRLTVTLIIGVMLLLSCHTHPHQFSFLGDVAHCPLCQILQCGFTFTPSFELILLMLTIGNIFITSLTVPILIRHPKCTVRAPPTLPLI
jgi:hypothetical protein